MPAKYNNERLCEFHKDHHRKQSSSVTQPSKHYDISNKIVKNSDLRSQVHPCLAWSSSSSSSSLTTDSLFSLLDSPSATSAMKYKTTGILFGNLDLVSFNPKIDPQPYACYNCWHFDHEYQDCPDIKIKNFCRNCGRRGVDIKECARCARAYMDYLNQSYNKHCEVIVNRPEVEKPIDDVELNIIKESYDESWDDVVEYDEKSPLVSFSEFRQKKETVYQDDDWDNYQSPRMDSIKKTSKLNSLNATKAEVAKYKDDSWSGCEVVNYSYSWGEYSYKTRGSSFIDPEERANNVEDWNYFEQDTIEEYSQNQFKSFTTFENERTDDGQAQKGYSIANNKISNLNNFCEESETGNYTIALNSIANEEYWTDFDDDYESLQESFAEEYKSLDNTMEDENDATNTFTDELFSFVENEKVDDVFVPKQNGYQANSLTSSVGSQSDEAYISNDEDLNDYEYMIVDENQRSEYTLFAGQAVQEFLHLLDTLKHLPIQTQNIAILHFISKQKEQAWQDQMQKRT